MKQMKRIGSFLLAMVFVLCLIPASALPVWAQDIYGTVYASALPAGSALELYAATTLVMDTDRTFASIYGMYDLTIQGGGTLTVEGNVEVGSLDVSLAGGDFCVGDGVRARDGGLYLSANVIEVESSKNYAIWTDNGSVSITATRLAAFCDGNGEGVGAQGGNLHITISDVAGIYGCTYGVYANLGNVTLDGGGTYTIGATGSSGSYDYDSNIGIYAENRGTHFQCT